MAYSIIKTYFNFFRLPVVDVNSLKIHYHESTHDPARLKLKFFFVHEMFIMNIMLVIHNIVSISIPMVSNFLAG